MATEWDVNAALRSAQIESGRDLTFSMVFSPKYSEIVKALKPLSIVEAGAGTGHLALTLAVYVETYVGVEPSEGMANEAEQVLSQSGTRIVRSTLQDFETDERFGLIISHMCLQAIEDVSDFLKSVEQLMAPGGGFLISFPHPAFYNDYKGFIPPQEYIYMHENDRLVDFAITLDHLSKVTGVPYFHRPLSFYFSALAKAGLNAFYVEEIWPEDDVQRQYPTRWKTPRYILLGGSRLSDMSNSTAKDSVSSRLMQLAKG